jgi:hypothetical protein
VARKDEQPTDTARERTAKTVKMAWAELPPDHRQLLEEVGASQWTVVEETLGVPVHRLLRSGGHRGLGEQARGRLEPALAAWVPDLRIVVFNARHPALAELGEQSFEQLVARTAWHEWGHALSIARCTTEDIANGARLLELSPTIVRNSIREAGYRPYEYTHELVADVYSILIARRQQKESGRPTWLNKEIYDLVKRVTEWPD